jgi:hypothetical protein
MSARIKIDQVGLPAGVAGQARTDGLDTGDLVTLEDVSGTGNSTFHLLWGPPDDPVAEATLAPTGDPNVWTFEPNSGSEGSYLIELRENGDPVERRVFGIRTAANHLLIPAFNERASRHAGWQNDGTDQTELSDNNAIDYADADLNDHPYAGWWRSLAELYRVVEAGTGGLADHSLPLVKLEFAPAKSVIANPLNVAGDAAYFASTTEFQYLRVNAANNALEWASLAAQGSTSILYDASTNTFVRAAVTGVVTAPQNSNTATFSVAAGKSVLINAANGSAVPAFVAGTAAFQYLRVNTGNNGLEWATLSTAASTSIIFDAASNTFRRAALTAGDVTAPVNDNTLTIVADAVTNTKAANMAANTQKANPTAGSADPQDMALAVQSLLLRAAGNIVNAACAADECLQRVGSADLGFAATPRLLRAPQILTSGTTISHPTGTRVIMVEGVGGGGASGGTEAVAGSMGGGGSSGTWGRRTFTAAAASSTYAIGAAGAGVSGATGGAGGSSTFTHNAVTLTLPGGPGGTFLAGASTVAVAPGGAAASAATNADISIAGMPGSDSCRTAAATTPIQAGAGGSNPLSSGGGNRWCTASELGGVSGSGFGAGGPGRVNGTSSTARVGNAGTAGAFIIWEFS